MQERRRGFGWYDQLRVLLPLLGIWGACVVLVGALLSTDKVSRAQLFLDSNEVVYLPWYTGLLSSVGVLLWSVAASIAGLTAYVAHLGRRPGVARMMAHGAFVGAVVCLDDLFELHASLIPNHTPFPKQAVLAMIAGLAISWVMMHLHEIARTRWQMLVAALGALSISIAVDVYNGGGVGRALILEDGAKLLGILAWATYFVLSSLDVLRSVVVELRTRSTEQVYETR